jgi:hypothetical protein
LHRARLFLRKKLSSYFEEFSSRKVEKWFAAKSVLTSSTIISKAHWIKKRRIL